MPDRDPRQGWGPATPRAPAGARVPPADAAERRAAREAEAELDRLTALARAGVVAARKLDYATQGRILGAMVRKAEEGHIQAARFVMEWLIKLSPSAPDDEPDDMVRPEDMTPAQRAALRARILRELGESDEEAA